MIKRLIFALILVLAAMPAWGTWTGRNNRNGVGTANPQCAATFGATLTNPSIILVEVEENGTAAISMPYDTAGNSYQDAGPGLVLYSSSTAAIEVFYALNTHTTSSNALCVANPNSLTMELTVTEFTGGATSSPIDKYSSAANLYVSGAGTDNLSSGPASTTLCGDLIFGASTRTSSSLNAGTNFTVLSDSYSYYTEYLVQTFYGSIAATWSTTGATYSAVIMVAVAPLYQSCSVAFSETNTASDSLARVAAYGRSDTETNTASDTISRQASFGRTDSETNVASDALARHISFGRGVTESNPAADLISRLAAFGRSDAETNIASDAIARVAAYGRNESETNTASDSISRVGAFTRADTESNTTFDSIARVGAFGRGIGESNTASDALARMAGYVRQNSETLNFSDSLTRMFAEIRAETETLATSDSLVRALAAFRSNAETLAFSDSLVGIWTHRAAVVVLPRHGFVVPGQPKSGTVPGQVKTGAVPGQPKSGEAPVH
jgi:hypothetical protein